MTDWLTYTRLGPFTKGEIPEPLQVTIQDVDGTAINLSGFTASFKIEAVDQTVSGLGAGTSSIPTAASGITQYAWVAADFTTAGFYRGQMWVGDGTNRYASEVYEWFVYDITDAPSI